MLEAPLQEYHGEIWDCEVKNRVALVTGASRGIGTAIATVLAREGARVFNPNTFRNGFERPRVHRALRELYRRLHDILVNNAGINFLAGLDELDSATLNETLQINLVAPLQLTRLVAERMRANRYGRIVNLVRFWSIVSKERRAAYAASKSAVNGSRVRWLWSWDRWDFNLTPLHPAMLTRS